MNTPAPAAETQTDVVEIVCVYTLDMEDDERTSRRVIHLRRDEPFTNASDRAWNYIHAAHPGRRVHFVDEG